METIRLIESGGCAAFSRTVNTVLQPDAVSVQDETIFMAVAA
jgi:hypothetical protein